MDANSSSDQLVLDRLITHSTRTLSDLQIHQLYAWGYLTFESVKQGEFEVGFIYTDLDQEIVYNLANKLAIVSVDKTLEACNRLNKWIQWLLGDVFVVSIKYNDKLIYRGVSKEVPDGFS